jgi:hypothetical protein
MMKCCLELRFSKISSQIPLHDSPPIGDASPHRWCNYFWQQLACVCDMYSGTNGKSRGQGWTKRSSAIKLRLSYDPFQNTKQRFIIRGLTLSMTVFLDVPRLAILLAGDGMTILESGLFPFFPDDFSNFVGIFIYLNCNLRSMSDIRISLVG